VLGGYLTFFFHVTFVSCGFFETSRNQITSNFEFSDIKEPIVMGFYNIHQKTIGFHGITNKEFGGFILNVLFHRSL
jgi:hypothetical protein